MNIRFPKEFIARDERLDFSDDGNRFRGYRYKNTVPISYLRYDDEVYCSIRLDYLLPYDEYCKSKAYEVNDEFNGISVNKFNMTKFLANCEEAFVFYANYNSPESKKQRIMNKIAEHKQQIEQLEMQKINLLDKIQLLNEELDKY